MKSRLLVVSLFVFGCKSMEEPVKDSIVKNHKKLPTAGTARSIIIEDDFIFAKKLIEGWSAISPAYLKHKLKEIHPGDLIEAPYFKALIQKYSADAEYVLDAATGNGWFAASVLKWDILKRLKRMVGVDISPVMIETARSQCDDSRASFYCGSVDAEIYDSIGISDASLDLIISSNALDCMQNIEDVLKRLHRLLKPDKCAVVSIRHPLRNAHYLTGSVEGDFQEGAYAEHWDGTGGYEVIRFFRKEKTWDTLFTQARFEIVEKVIPVISEDAKEIYPQHYAYYKNKKHPGALIYVLRCA